MPQNTNGRQLKSFEEEVVLAMVRHPRLRTVSAIARRLRRPRTSVSRAIHKNVFPELQRKIAGVLGL
jgi:O6-methylguanine-DNA--protein-cysteine methyltransferase